MSSEVELIGVHQSFCHFLLPSWQSGLVHVSAAVGETQEEGLSIPIRRAQITWHRNSAFNLLILTEICLLLHNICVFLEERLTRKEKKSWQPANVIMEVRVGNLWLPVPDRLKSSTSVLCELFVVSKKNISLRYLYVCDINVLSKGTLLLFDHLLLAFYKMLCCAQAFQAELLMVTENPYGHMVQTSVSHRPLR